MPDSPTPSGAAPRDEARPCTEGLRRAYSAAYDAAARNGKNGDDAHDAGLLAALAAAPRADPENLYEGWMLAAIQDLEVGVLPPENILQWLQVAVATIRAIAAAGAPGRETS